MSAGGDETKYIVCSTGLTPEENNHAQSIALALAMAWDDDLHAGVTHLLAKGVGSEKYKAAVAAGMIVVKIEWLVESQKQGKVVPADDFKLGILEGLCICTTGLYVEDRDMVEQLCEEHHAIYQPDLSFGTTTHLLAEQVGGAKYDAAIAHGIPVVTLEWIAACVEAKAYVDEDRFRLQDDDNQEDESGPTSMKLNDELTQCIAQLRDEPRGEFLDGCVFWISGFSPESILKMKWLIRFGMGSRYDAYNSSVTHIIAEVAGNWRHLSDNNGSLEIVSPKWLIESCLAFECMQESLFPVLALQPPQIKVVAKPSPPQIKRPPPPPNPVIPVVEAPVEKPTEVSPQPRQLFSGFMVLFLRTWPVDQRPNGILKCKVESAGGRYRDINTIDPRILQANEIKRITHIVVGHGVEMPEGMLQSLCESLPRAKVVTELWVHCCVQENHLFSRRSHDLFSISRSSTRSVFPQLPLPCFRNVVASISLYVNVERTVLSVLLELAGAKVTARLSKRNTHLLCCLPEGPKYSKAVQWKLHIVNSQWLIRSMIAQELEPIPNTLDMPTPTKRKRDSQDEPNDEEEEKQPQINRTPEATSFGPLTQLNNMLDAFDDQESCSIGFVQPRPKVNVVHQVQAAANPNFFQDSEAQLPNSEVLSVAMGNACINDCSGHGSCREYECLCHVGFHGEDCSLDLARSNAPVPLLSVGDFNLTSLASLRTLQRSKKITLLGVSSSACAACIQYEQEYPALLHFLAGKKIKFGRLDCAKQARICQDIGITSPPAIAIVGRGKMTLYHGIQRSQDIVAFVNKLEGPSAVRLDSIDSVIAFKEQHQVIVVGFFYTKKCEEFREFQEMAAAIQKHDIAIAFVVDKIIVNYFIEEKLWIRSGPALYLWNGHRAVHLNLEEGVPENSLDKTISLDQWVLQQAIPVVGILSPLTYDLYAATGRPMFILFMDFTRDMTSLHNDYRLVASRYAEILSFTIADGVQYRDRMRSLGLMGDIPALAINTRDERQLPFPASIPLNEATMSTFANAYLSGKLQSVDDIFKAFAAAPTEFNKEDFKVVPGVAEHYTTDDIGLTVIHDFVTQVANTARDVVVLFHSRDCLACMHLAPHYKRVAKRVAEMNIQTLIVASMDLSEMAPPPNVIISSLPIIVLFPASSKEPPYLYYSGSGRALPILQWLHSNVNRKFELPELPQFNSNDRALYKEQINARKQLQSKKEEL